MHTDFTPREITRSPARIGSGALVLCIVLTGLWAGIVRTLSRPGTPWAGLLGGPSVRDSLTWGGAALAGAASIWGCLHAIRMTGRATITPDGLRIHREGFHGVIEWGRVKAAETTRAGTLVVRTVPNEEEYRWTSAELGIPAETAAGLIREQMHGQAGARQET